MASPAIPAAIRSVPEPAHVDGRFFLRGSIDLIERHSADAALRVTDHKTGKNRTTSLATMVQGGRVLQPMLYGMALEAISGEQVESGRLFYCTTVGGFSVRFRSHWATSPSRGLEVLEMIDRPSSTARWRRVPPTPRATAISSGVWRRRGTAHASQAGGALFADLDALRRMP